MEELFDEGLADITERYIDFFTQSPTWLICTYIAFMIVTLFYVVKYCDTLHPIIWTALALAFPFISLVVIVVQNTLVISKRRKQAPDVIHKHAHGIHCRIRFVVIPILGAGIGLLLGIVCNEAISTYIQISFSEWMLSGALLLFVIMFIDEYYKKQNKTRYFIVSDSAPVADSKRKGIKINGHILAYNNDCTCTVEHLSQIISHYYTNFLQKNVSVGKFYKSIGFVKYEIKVLKEEDYDLIKDIESVKEISILSGYKCYEIQYVDWNENEDHEITGDSDGMQRRLWRVCPIEHRLYLEAAVSLAVIFTILTPAVINMHLSCVEYVLNILI